MNTRTLATALVAAPLAIALFAGVASADTLTRQLQQGMSGDDVSALQTFLAQDSTIYPQGKVTGYFGPLTFAAVSNFQSRNGIATVGRVGPVTMAAINSQMGGAISNAEGAGKPTNVGATQPVITGVAVTTTANSANVTWNSNVSATAKVWYSTNAAFNLNTTPNAVNTAYANAQSVTITGLASSTTYYYVVESTDAQGNFSWNQFGSSFKTQ